MEKKDQTAIIILLSLIVGLIVGYFLSVNTFSHHRFFFNSPMHQEMWEHMSGEFEEHMHQYETLNRDGR